MNGQYRNTVDDKGRLMIPPKLREQLGSTTVYITQSMGESLWIFTEKDFQDLNQSVNYNPLSIFNDDAHVIQALILSPAREVEMDKAGRINIPKELRDFADLELKEECVIQGAMTYIEIWNAKKYDEFVIQKRAQLKNSAQALSKIGMGK